MKKITFLCLIFLSLTAPAQEKSVEKNSLDQFNDSLKSICKKLYTSKKDADKKKYNQQLLNTFELALNTANSFDYPFDSLNDIER